MGYPGGKAAAGVYQTIINQLPPHRVRIVPFAGEGGVSRKMRPAEQIIALDLNRQALAKWSGRRSPTAIRSDASRLHSGLNLIHGCGVEFLESYPWRGNELVYADPPYMLEARSTPQRYYRHELWDMTCSTATPDDRARRQADRKAHARLLKALCRLPCPVALSGYMTDFYTCRLADWRLITFRGQTRAGCSTECLWMNYPTPTALHDYSHLGEDFRERERIKRKARRWATKYSDLPTLERQAILSAMLDIT